jgi:hypothetical protein
LRDKHFSKFVDTGKIPAPVCEVLRLESNDMNELEWFRCTSPKRMLEWSQVKISERKLRLFACACVRRVWYLLTDKRGRKAVEASERFADGSLNRQALGKASGEANWAVQYAAELAQIALRAASHVADATWIGHPEVLRTKMIDAVGLASCAGEDVETEQHAQVLLLHDLLGNPCCVLDVDDSWLTPKVVALAKTAYEVRRLPSGTLESAQLAVLADALDDAGCTDTDILNHLRGPGPHVRGCHVIDALLGRT